MVTLVKHLLTFILCPSFCFYEQRLFQLRFFWSKTLQNFHFGLQILQWIKDRSFHSRDEVTGNYLLNPWTTGTSKYAWINTLSSIPEFKFNYWKGILEKEGIRLPVSNIVTSWWLFTLFLSFFLARGGGYRDLTFHNLSLKFTDIKFFSVVALNLRKPFWFATSRGESLLYVWNTRSAK